MSDITHEIMLVKPAKRRLDADSIDGNVRTITAAVNTPRIAARWNLDKDGERGWRQRPGRAQDNAAWVYEMLLALTFKGEGEPAAHEARGILRDLHMRAAQNNHGKWTLATVDGDEYVPLARNAAVGALDPDVGYAPVHIPPDWRKNFSHLYGLGPQIQLVMDSIKTAIDSDWELRYHALLAGDPACGKSDVAESFARALGWEAVMRFDATCMTAAGAIKELTEERLLKPRIIVIEEIEKAVSESLLFLLGVLDLRAAINKVTANAKTQAQTKMLAIATANDIRLLESSAAGALDTRSSKEVWFKRPTREVMERILARDIAKVRGGDVRWIKPALDYCEEMKITDPRKVGSLCITGGDGWLTGERRELLAVTARPAA